MNPTSLFNYRISDFETVESFSKRVQATYYQQLDMLNYATRQKNIGFSGYNA